MRSLSFLILKYRWFILSFTAVLTIGLALQLPHLESDDDIMTFLPADHPDVRLFNRVNDRFGGLDVAIVGVEASTMLSYDNIHAVREMTRAFSEIDGVFDVLSFTEVPDPQPAPDGLRVTPLVMDTIPRQEVELNALRNRILSNENAVGNLISEDGKAAMILCFLGGKRLPMYIAGDIQETARRMWSTDALYFAGSPFVRHYLAGGTHQDLVRLTPFVALVVLFVTFLVFRRVMGVVLALGVVGVAIVWVLGIISLRGEGLTLVGASLPTILIAIGGAYGIHILAAYFNGNAPTVAGRITETLREMGPPVIASALTTSAGFLSFLVMDIAPLRDFGVQAALGVLITAVLAVVTIPAVLSFADTPPRGLGQIISMAPLRYLAVFAEKRRKRILVCSGVLGVVALGGVCRVAPDATMESFFSRESPPALANDFLVRHFGGATYLQVYFEGNMRSPFVLKQMQKIVEHARRLPEVEHVSSIIDSLVMMNQAMGGRADLPQTVRQVGSLYPFLAGTAAIDQLISPDKRSSLIQIRLKDVGADNVYRVMESLRSFIDTKIPPGIRAIQMDDSVSRTVLETAYSTPAEYDVQGNEIVPEERMPVDPLPDTAKLIRLRQDIRNDVAERIDRLLAVAVSTRDLDKRPSLEVLRAILQQEEGVLDTAGQDLDDATERAVQEHVGRHYAFIDPEDAMVEETGNASVGIRPVPQVLDDAAVEWRTREARVRDAIAKRMDRLQTRSQVAALLTSVLPITVARDKEGLELTADALHRGLQQEWSAVKAARLFDRISDRIVGVELKQSDRATIAAALTDLDMPIYGFPASSAAQETVLARVTGAPVINVALCNSTIANQIKSLAVALIVLLIILFVLFGSVSMAFKGIVPSLLMLALATGVMGVAAIPIDLTTSMIAAIAIGIGVDYAIHFLWRRRRRGENLTHTIQAVGPSIVANAIQVASGFAVLCVSTMVPMQRFGLLVAMTMILSAVSTFLILPAACAPHRTTSTGARKTT